MIVRQAAALAGMALLIVTSAAHAGPCTDRISQTNLDVAKALDSAEAPGNISATEQAGDLTSEEAREMTEDMDEARHADDEGDGAACEKALGEVERLLKR
jgi:hypothetical protein